MRALVAALVLLLSSCLEVPPDSVGQGDDPDAPLGPGFRKRLEIPAASVDAPLGDFPVLVDLPADDDLAARASDAGLDIVFRDPAGNLLRFEREAWNGELGSLRAWVVIPELPVDRATEFYLHYGDGSDAERSVPAEVWSGEFATVWHLNEEPDEAIDSTASGNHAVGSGGSAARTEGYLGSGVALDGSGDFIDFGDQLPDAVDAGQVLTVTAWVRFDSLDAWSHFVSKAPIGSNSHGWALGIDVDLDFMIRSMNGNVNSRGWTDAAQPLTGTWHHWAMVYDGSQANDELRLRGFRDGVEYPLAYSAAIPTMFDSQGGPLYVGCATWNITDYCIEGVVDEVHVATTPRSPEWILAEWASQVDGGPFLTIGDEEAL